MATPIRKAILPVAGLGTRFLPATKAVPKEMLTVVDRPVVQHVVDEARAAGIEHIVFVTGRNKGVIEDHFDRQYELEATLSERGKHQILDALREETMGPGKTSFTRQQLPLGLGHAVWCARDIIGNEPFALLLPDMLHKPRNGKGCLAQMVDAYKKAGGGNHLAVYEVPKEQTDQYGIVGLGEALSDNVHRISRMVEKPKTSVAPSNLAISGRYILQPEIFDLLATQERGAGGEIQLTDSMLKLAKKQDFYSVTFDGSIYDCGSKLGFLMANVAYALSRPDIAETFRPELDALLAQS